MAQPANAPLVVGHGQARPMATTRQAVKKILTAPPATLLMGAPGSGKTHSIITALLAGLKVFVIITEGNGLVTLRKAMRQAKAKNPGLTIENLHWATITPTPVDLAMLKAKAELSNRNTMGELQGLVVGLDKPKFQQYIHLIRLMGNLTCDRTGQSFGNIAELDDTWLVVVDSFTGLTTMVAQNVKGLRPGMTQPEIGIAQEHLRDTVNILTSLSCFILVTAHLEREPNEIQQREKIMVSTVGKKLAPQLVGPFSEVLLAYRVSGEGFFWSNDDQSAELKHRLLPLSTKINPDFGVLVEAYRTDKALAEGGDFE